MASNHGVADAGSDGTRGCREQRPVRLQPGRAAAPRGRRVAVWRRSGLGRAAGAAAQQPMPYGSPPGYAPVGYPAYAPPAPTNGVGVAGFVTGLVGLVLCWIPFLGFLLAGTGVVLSGVGISQGRKTGASTGLAIAGLVCGIIGAIPGLLVLVAFLSAVSY